MNADLSQRINPSISPFGNSKIGINTSGISAPAHDSNSDKKTDFASLVGSSNIDVKEERNAKKKGDLAGKSDQELFENLNKESILKDPPKNQLDKDDFLKLFIAQLQNQDPLKPKEDYEMAAQMAQFNGLEQMLNLNKKFDDLVNIQKQGQAVTMIDYVGKEVSVDGGKALFDGKSFSGVSFNADFPVNEVVLSVRDSSGSIVAEENIGAINPGNQNLTQEITKGKDGAPVKSGVYTVALHGKGPQGEPVTLPVTTTIKVTGIDIKNNMGSFKTPIGPVGIEEISSVATPGSSNSEDTVKSRDNSIVAPQPKNGDRPVEPTLTELANATKLTHPEPIPEEGKSQGIPSQKAVEATNKAPAPEVLSEQIASSHSSTENQTRP